MAGKVTFDPRAHTVVIHAPLGEKELAAAAACVVTLEARGRILEAAAEVRAIAEAAGTAYSSVASPHARGLPFSVPCLCVREGQKIM